MSVPAPPGTRVALLARRGRFTVAEPFFPASRDEPRRGRNSQLMVIAPGRRQGARAAAIGELVLIGPPTAAGGREARGRGQIIRRIGRPDIAADVIEALMLDRGLRRGFDPVVEREARQVSRERDGAGEARRDLRDLPTFTIDPASARDFDDAISAERQADGTVRVWVHIADVSAYVREDSPLDREARRRATSVYVPGAVEPMLPAALSADACSLRPGVERLAVTVQLDLDGATVKRVEFHRATIRSDARLTYEQVDAIFAGQQSASEPWGGALAAARSAAAALQQARERRGALTLDAPEPEFSFDAAGNVSDIQMRAQTEAHRLIEHLMIAANEAVASLLEQRKLPCLYRVHERPDPERVKRLVDQLATLDVPTPPVPEQMSAADAADLIGEISLRVERHIARSVARAPAGRSVPFTGGRLALTYLLLRSLKQAYYSPRNIGHAGLGSSCYCHFTSPIRRYPDLVCHRALLRAIGRDSGGLQAGGGLVELGEWTSEGERYAMTIERDGDDVARCFSLEQLLYRDGWERPFAGEITGLISAGAFVAFGPADSERAALATPLYEGMLPVRRLTGGGASAGNGAGGKAERLPRTARQAYSGREWWELGEHGTVLHGTRSGARLRLGDPIEVRVAAVDVVRGRVDLALGS